MRVVFAVAAGLMWATAAHAQTTQPDTSSSEPTMSQAQSPAANTASTAQTDPNAQITVEAQTAHDREIVCHTTMATGSRLAGRGHGIRTCKTRQQWEMEEVDLQHRFQATNQQAFQGDGQRTHD
jgi:hypothetical protein